MTEEDNIAVPHAVEIPHTSLDPAPCHMGSGFVVFIHSEPGL